MPKPTAEEIVQIMSQIGSSFLNMDIASSHGASSVKSSCLEADVRISGDASARICLEIPKSLSQKMAAVIFEKKSEDVTSEDMKEAVAEVANMTAGNIKALYEGENKLSIPIVRDVSASWDKDDDDILSVDLSCSGEILRVIVN